MPAPEPLAALVLAAGNGVRMGGVAKPLIRIGGQAIVCRLVQSLQTAGIERIVVVIGPHTQGVQQALNEGLAALPSDLSFVPVKPGSDQMHSLQQGLKALADLQAGVMVCLADQPLIDPQAVSALQAAFVRRPAQADMVLPCVQGRPGNPVVLSAQLVREWLALPEQQIGKAWRKTHAQRVYSWPTPLTQYTTDLDTPEDLQALRSAGLSVSLP